MEIPKNDTPTPRIIELGFGGEVDAEAVQECMDVLRIAKKCLGRFHLLFKQQGISPGKYAVLMELLALGTQQSLHATDIATRVGVKPPTITGIIDGLVKQNLVRRRSAASDRRKVTISITAQGRSFMKKLLPTQFAAMAELVTGLSGKDRSSLNSLLLRFEESFDARS